MSSSNYELEVDLVGALNEEGPYNIMAFSKTMQANRLSYFLNLTGPSFTLDSSSCGGIQALQYAFDLIQTGMCTAAIVGCSSLIHKAEASFHYQMMGRVSEDCFTRSFSSDATGFARSEGCVAVFLQQKEHAKRIYATVLGTNVNYCGSKSNNFPGFPRELYDKFLLETYEKDNVDPSDLVYLEAHGAASKKLDALELNSLSKALLKQRSKPLLIGSIKSNLGHAEGASSMISLTKALMALDRGIIPPNINYSQPNPDVPDLVSGNLQVVTEPTPIEGGTVAVCELGVTGTFAHVILKGNGRVKLPKLETGGNKVPYLLTLSARTENGLEKNLKDLEERGVDEELVLLINSLYREGIKNHAYAGYSVISDEPNNYKMMGRASEGQGRPIWFMYSGMGSQWPAMAKALMELPIFAKAIHKCHKILEHKGINLLDIISRDDPAIFDNILNSFVGIAAVQIGLTDVLKAVGIEPDGIIGHSVGEMGCAYADGCMTAEQMILAAHARGRASVETKLIRGMMAAVGAGYSQMKNVLPGTIEVACHNSKDSCTLSGPADDMEDFIAKLKANGMFAKLVNVANIAYHSRYIKPASAALLEYLKEILTVPVKRSSKWVSSSHLERNWDTDLAQHSSAEYHTNNLLSPVFFEEASSHIPLDAIVIEIAPHGLLQAIVKRSLPQAIHIPLTNRFDQNNLMFFLSALGKMFMAGIPVDLQAIYPTAMFPVSRGTPGISALIDWSRDEKFQVKREISDLNAPSILCRYVKMDESHDDYDMVLSHKINGKSIIPSSFYFREIIDHFARLRNYEITPVAMEKIAILGYAQVQPSTSTELRFQLLQGTGSIVVNNNVTTKILFDGIIKQGDNELVKGLIAPETPIENKKVIGHDEMKNLMESFGVVRDTSVVSIDNITLGKEYCSGTVRWEGDIGKFLMSILALIEFVETRNSYILKMFHSAREIMINLPFLYELQLIDLSVVYNLVTKELLCEGVRIAHIECRNPGFTQHINKDYVLELPQFIPYINDNLQSLAECANMCIQLILENIHLGDDTTVKIIEVGLDPELHISLKEIVESIKYGGHTSLTAYPTERQFHKECLPIIKQKHLWIVCAEAPSLAMVQSIVCFNDGFILSPRDKKGQLERVCNVVFETQVSGKWYALYTTIKPILSQHKVIRLNNEYLPQLETQLLITGGSESIEDNSERVFLWGKVDSSVAVYHILEETADLPNSQHLHYWLFHGKDSEVDFSDAEFKRQLGRGVRINILKDGKWGHLRLMPLNATAGLIDSSSPFKIYYPLSAVVASNNILALGLNFDYTSTDTTIPKLGAYDYVSSNESMGIGTYDPYSKTFTPDPILSWQKPRQCTLKEAATIPVLYSLAVYMLHYTQMAGWVRGKLDDVDTILVNRALLPLSQAIISLALYENKEVHATVYGEREKQELLLSFPKLKPNNIYDCSTVSFYAEVLRNTRGGVDTVINNFDDPIMIGPCAKCTSPYGVLIYASQSLMNSGAVMGMQHFVYNIATGVSEAILINSSEDVKNEIKNELTKAIQNGGVVPITATSSVPQSMLNTEAAAYLKSHLNKIIVETAEIDPGTFILSDHKPHVIVEGKVEFNLTTDIIEWLLKRGTQKVLLLKRSLEANTLREQSLCEHYKNAVIEVHTSNQLSDKGQVEKFIKECSPLGPSMVFFLGSGLKEKIELFDEILSQEYPHSRMICIGKEGESVCTRRTKNALPSLHIRCNPDSMDSNDLNHCLDSLINDSSKVSLVLVKKYASHDGSVPSLLADMKNFPDTEDGMIHIMSYSKVTDATFVEIPSSAPRLKQNREVYPMFLIPGLRPNRLRKLAAQLLCPTMEARIPANTNSIDKIANELTSHLLSLPQNMFTLCAEGWGGILGLHVASKLEAKSKYVNLILLDASPASIIKWSMSLLRNEEALLRKYFLVPPAIVFNMENASWGSKLQFAIDHSPLKEENEKSISIECLNILRMRLLSVVDAKPPSEKFNIKCHLFRLPSHTLEDHGLGDYLLNEPILHTKNSNTVEDMIDKDVATEVNSLLLFEHKDAANPPIEEYLGCNIIEKSLPNWLQTRLSRVRE